MTKLTTPPVLAFEAKLSCSDAFMFYGTWEDLNNKNVWQPISVYEKSVRGTISNRLKGADASKIDAKVENANLQTVDNAALPFDSDTLKVTFTLRVLGDLTTPSACSSPEYENALKEKITEYIKDEGFKTLAKRYAINLANGRFLWRNRVGAEQVTTRITFEDNTWEFDSFSFPLHDFSANDPEIEKIADAIELGLLGKKPILLKIESFIQLGSGQTVFPSQELVIKPKPSKGEKKNKSEKSKYLYQINGQAAMHSQKIGNALRTIDTWYPEAVEHGPIAIETYGSVTSKGIAYRKPKENTDFYSLLDSWVLKNNPPSEEEQHYIIAMLIRGGVFGEKNE